MIAAVLYVTLAVALFFVINWIGEHATDFGYISTTLFEEPTESVALNFFIRALSPAVYIILASAVAVGLGFPEFRMGIYWVSVVYFSMRLGAIFLFNRQRLISWWRFLAHVAIGAGSSWLAFQHLIIPNRSLLPDLEGVGNELWLAIAAFLYTVANKVPLAKGPGARRRNGFIRLNYNDAVKKFGPIIDGKVDDDLLKLTAYSIIIYEGYCRPPAIRKIENAAFWKRQKTTGIMQVSSTDVLTDETSVEAGCDILLKAWDAHSNEEYLWSRVRETIADFNRDSDYIGRVFEVMEILAKQVDRRFAAAYDRQN